jgi:hypothetical protein
VDAAREDWGVYENAAPFEHLDYRRSCVVLVTAAYAVGFGWRHHADSAGCG